MLERCSVVGIILTVAVSGMPCRAELISGHSSFEIAGAADYDSALALPDNDSEGDITITVLPQGVVNVSVTLFVWCASVQAYNENYDSLSAVSISLGVPGLPVATSDPRKSPPDSLWCDNCAYGFISSAGLFGKFHFTDIDFSGQYINGCTIEWVIQSDGTGLVADTSETSAINTGPSPRSFPSVSAVRPSGDGNPAGAQAVNLQGRIISGISPFPFRTHPRAWIVFLPVHYPRIHTAGSH
jgi:hypothetical protein